MGILQRLGMRAFASDGAVLELLCAHDFDLILMDCRAGVDAAATRRIRNGACGRQAVSLFAHDRACAGERA